MDVLCHPLHKRFHHRLFLSFLRFHPDTLWYIFVGPDEIQALNSEYRGIDRVTDVLSFPQFAALADEVPEVGEICLGDVVICKDKAEAQAEEFGHSFERELVYLFVHSVLHLLGYDHEEENDKKIMRQREEEIMAYMEIPR